MSIRIDGTNTAANPGITGADADTGLQFGTDEIQLVTGGTNRATVESNGNFTIEDGNLVVAAGHGIDFSADGNAAGMTSELLDDYEEGTFTVAVLTGVTSPTYTNTLGSYVKVGRSVMFTIRISVQSGTNNSGQVKLGPLPFASSSSFDEGGAGFSYLDNINGLSDVPLAHIGHSSTILAFYEQDGTIWQGNKGNGLVSRTLHIHGQYFV